MRLRVILLLMTVGLIAKAYVPGRCYSSVDKTEQLCLRADSTFIFTIKRHMSVIRGTGEWHTASDNKLMMEFHVTESDSVNRYLDILTGTYVIDKGGFEAEVFKAENNGVCDTIALYVNQLQYADTATYSINDIYYAEWRPAANENDMTPVSDTISIGGETTTIKLPAIVRHYGVKINHHNVSGDSQRAVYQIFDIQPDSTVRHVGCLQFTDTPTTCETESGYKEIYSSNREQQPHETILYNERKRDYRRIMRLPQMMVEYTGSFTMSTQWINKLFNELRMSVSCDDSH